MKKIKGLFIGMGFGIIGFASIQLQAQSTFTASYAFSSVTTSSGTTDPTPPPIVAGLVFSPFSAGGYSGSPNAAGRFSWTSSEVGGVNGDDNFANFSGTINTGKYFEVTITPDALTTLNLDSITFGIRRSSAGIRSYSVRSSLDAFAVNLPAAIAPANPNLGIGPDNSLRWLFDATATSADQVGSQIALGGGFDALIAPVTFRFYAWNAESSSGTFSIDDVLFSGDVKSVPEPGGSALICWGAALFALRQIDRQRRARKR